MEDLLFIVQNFKITSNSILNIWLNDEIDKEYLYSISDRIQEIYEFMDVE